MKKEKVLKKKQKDIIQEKENWFQDLSARNQIIHKPNQ